MFLHSTILLLGAVAATLPLVIHWLTKPKPARLPLSTIRFVQAAIEQRRARHWLRDILVLTLRTLAILLLAGAIARPIFQAKNRNGSADTAEQTIRVVIVDVSQSMGAEAGGVTAFERARATVARHLEFRTGLRTNLLLAAAQPRPVFAEPSSNFPALREALTAAAVRPERLLVQPALNAAAEMLAVPSAANLRRELVVVSDFQRTNWSTADFASLPTDTVIELESVAPAATAENLAVLQVRPVGQVAAGQEQRVEVEVGNFSATSRPVEAELRLGDSTHRLKGHVPAFSKSVLVASIGAQPSGWHFGEARLLNVDDSLAADDWRACVLRVPPPPTYLLISRQPEKLRPSSSYYLERALAAADNRNDTGQNPVLRLRADALDNQSLSGADVIVLDHPGSLPGEAVNVLAALVRRGRGLLYLAAEPVDAINLKLIGEALGPAARMPVEFQPPSASPPRRDLVLASFRRQQPPFAVFGDDLAALANPLKFTGGLSSRRTLIGLEDDVRSTFSDGSAFVVASTCDAGTLVVVNADLERSNLPTSGLFVPLIAEVTQELLQKDRKSPETPAGEPISLAVPVPSDAIGELKVVSGQEADVSTGEFTLEAGGPQWRTTAIGPPGVYEIRRTDETVTAVSAVISEEESDLRTLTADVFEGRLSGQRDVRFRTWSPEANERQDRAWAWLAIGCLLCVLSEFGVLRWFRG